MAAACAAYHYASSSRETIFEPTIKTIETQTPCPWSNAETELTNWFPGATGYSVQDVALSGKRLELQRRLGRPLLPEDMELHSYAVSSNGSVIGTVLTRRIKGEHGAIELALALDSASRIEHFKIQSCREPTEIINALKEVHLESRLQHKTVQDDFAFDFHDIPGSAHKIALQLTEAVKTLLILQEAGCHEVHHLHH